jgi:GcrA cell cycle regulator
MAAEKFSGGQIGKTLKRTRSMVAGKCHRMGIKLTSERYGLEERKPKRERRPRPKPIIVVAPPKPPKPEKPKPIEPVGVSLLELDRRKMCCWPIGDPRTSDFAYCGRTDKEAPHDRYCMGHAKLGRDASYVYNAKYRGRREELRISQIR